MISAVILAAGESKRMGQPKQLLPLGGKTIVEHALDNVLASRVDEVILVTGNEAETVASMVGKRKVKVIVNPDYRLGMSTSLKKGLESVDTRAEAVMVVLADQPFIDAGLMNRLINAFQTSRKGIIVPVFQARRGHPTIFSIKYWGELRQLTGDSGAKAVLERHPDDVFEVKASQHIHIDIDDRESYEKQKNSLGLTIEDSPAPVQGTISQIIDRPADLNKAKRRVKSAGIAGIALALLTAVQFFFPFAAGLSPAAVVAGIMHAATESTGVSILGIPPYFFFSIVFFLFIGIMTAGIFRNNMICSVVLFSYSIICFVFSLSITTILFVVSTIIIAAIAVLLFYGMLGTFDYGQLQNVGRPERNVQK